MWLKQWLSQVEIVDFRRKPTLDLVECISTRWLDPYLGSPLEMHARTVAQYYGMARYRSYWQRALRRFASVAALVLFLVKNAARGLKRTEGRELESVDGVKTGGDLREYELPPEFANSSVRSWVPQSGFLPWGEVASVVQGFIAVGCWEPEVHCKSLLALSDQVGLFSKYRPRFVMMYKEYDFVCSMLTWQCRAHGAESYNVMHGDKAYLARDAFFAVDRYYVWHQGYGDIARDMKADPGQVVVYTPDRMRPPQTVSAPIARILVLLPAYPLSKSEEDAWISALSAIAEFGSVRVRPHPRNPFNPRLRSMVVHAQGIEVSDPKTEGAVEAISSVSAIVGLQSTMLIEALCQGIRVYCIRDKRLEQMLDYHPFFRDKRVRITTIGMLPNVLETGLA